MQSIVTDREACVVCLSVCNTSEPCKNGWTGRSAVWVKTRVSPGYHMWVQILYGKGEVVSHCKVLGHFAVVYAKTALIEIPFGLRTQVGSGNHVLDGCPNSPWERVIFGERRAHCKYRDFLWWAEQERLNRSICRLDCGLGWAEGSTTSIIFARWCHCVHMGRHIGTNWRIRLNHPSAEVMRSYIKLLWPLVFV